MSHEYPLDKMIVSILLMIYILCLYKWYNCKNFLPDKCCYDLRGNRLFYHDGATDIIFSFVLWRRSQNMVPQTDELYRTIKIL